MSLALLLLQIAVILGACRLAHGIFGRFGQPPVIGEIIAGLLLGPSLLGWVAPSAYAYLFARESLPALGGLSQIGLVLFMFLVGLRLDLSEVYEFRRVAGVSGVLSIVIPFGAGLLLARPLHALAPAGSPMLPFSLFIAVSMSITAFPVLARILADHGLTSTRLGHIAIACAAFDDVTAWTMLAGITALTRSSQSGNPLLGPALLLLGYVVVMFFPVRIGIKWLTARFQPASELPVILVFVFLSAWVTESAGLHALFGAFLAGVVWPRDHTVIDRLCAKIEPIAMMVLIPLFFSYTGVRTNIGLVSGGLWLYLVAIVAVAIVGKAGGAITGARLMGFSVRDSLALGCLMNTRGLVELVALNVGMDLGILSPALFSMMVVMALVTTLMTAPLLSILLQTRTTKRANSVVIP